MTPSSDIILHAPAAFDAETLRIAPLSLAIAGGGIAAAGTRERIDSMKGPSTTVIDLPQNGLLVPGFHDFHIHLFAGSLTLESADLHSARSEEEAAVLAAEFAAAHESDEWIFGFNWYHVSWDRKQLPTRKSLDRLIPDRPVFLFNAEYHGAWVNSLALKICGVDRNTPDPPFGRIERDSAGEPTGYLYETAMGLVGKRALDLPDARRERLLRKFLRKAARTGVTSVHDMLPLPGLVCGDPGLYAAFEGKGDLSLRIFLEGDLAAGPGEARTLRDRYGSELLSFSGLKQFVDGVATTYTAFLVEPYTDRPESRGGTLIPPDTLCRWVTEADAAGFRIRLHACGDGAVRLALDCYEAAALKNGRRDSRHTIEHMETIHPADLPRLRDLGVVASIQPEHLAATETYPDTPYPIRLGAAREPYLWPNGSLRRLGIAVCYGTDFPVVDLDPFSGIYRAVTRVHNDGLPVGGWNQAEKVDPAYALACFTRAGAYGSFREGSLGLLKPGFAADIAFLDRNILTCEPETIRETRNLLTISDGKIRYRAV